jgi:hypothetical protein
LLAYIYHFQSGSGPEYHYTATDLLMAALVIIPGLIVWVSVLFAQPITDSIATWWAERKERKRQRALALRQIRERKFQSVGRSRWHGRN